MGQNRYKKRLLDVRKDRLDLRDRAYRPILKSLSESYPKASYLNELILCYRADGMILDQGEDGACTGFALAAVINYLMRQKAIVQSEDDSALVTTEKVSPQMLYNLARIYDEWDGEDYEGSSCRGAMKGWHRHGVCAKKLWEKEKSEPDAKWAKDAIERPLGAYYRVDKNSISDMQSALCEVGALYASATVHDGWWALIKDDFKPIEEINEDLPCIEYKPFPIGKHAFVIVGYNRKGFIVQNSWGNSWGNCGFAVISYQDWLSNGMDVWVAVIGVPIEVGSSSKTFSNLSLSSVKNEAKKGTTSIQKSLKYSYKNLKSQPLSEEQAYKHTLVLNGHGRAKHTMVYLSDVEESMNVICYKKPKAWLEKRKKNCKIVLYALGGLKDEEEYLSRVRILTPYFLQNGMYPIFLTWQNSYFDVISQSIDDFLKRSMEENVLDMSSQHILQEKEALNRAIENHCRKIATRAIWAEVQEKAKLANSKKIDGFNEDSSVCGALYLLTNALEKLKNEGVEFELHAIAHSAGSQLLATTWLRELAKRKMILSSMHLLAPTISIEECNKEMQYAYKKGVFQKENIYIYMLDEAMERADKVSTYGQSILYLISRALDKIHKIPLLGLEDSWVIENAKNKDGLFNTRQLNQIRRWNRFAFDIEHPFNLFFLGKEHQQLEASVKHDLVKLNHQNLDRSLFVLNRILKIISKGNLDKSLDIEIENLI